MKKLPPHVLIIPAAAAVALAILAVPHGFSGDPKRARGRRSLASPWYVSHRSVRAKQIEALAESYGPLIERVERQGDEVVFSIRGRRIYYKDGRMLGEGNLHRASDYTSIFYDYVEGPLTSPVGPRPPQRWSNDFLDAAVGSTEHEVRASSAWVDFLGRKVFVNALCAEPLRRVEAGIRAEALNSEEVRDFISRIKVVYSMKRRLVKGTGARSYHAYGLAIDIIPTTYQGKHVYWLWSSKLIREWDEIPLSARWHPPEEVIESFERNGFVWGGKWYRFDTVHFEYRPEILLLAEKPVD